MLGFYALRCDTDLTKTTYYIEIAMSICEALNAYNSDVYRYIIKH